MSTASTLAESYDDVPFPSLALPQSHPDRLAMVATLFGMCPQPIDRCRVLELGCSSGANLIPMADRHPQSRFVGVDFSAGQIATARRLAEALELQNIELKHASIMDIDASLGSFDYIVAHGLYSWVSRPVREKLLAICRSNLAPGGVAYVSYNLYPGWHLRNISRALMCAAAPGAVEPRQRVARGRKLLEFFSRSLADGAPYGRVLKADIDLILQQHDNYLLHDFFEEENYPLYFHEFIEHAAAHDLQYLGDATPGTMVAANYGPAVEENLARVAPDLISMEQHLDLLRNRAFRQTLLCHREVAVVRRIDPDQFAKLFLAAQIRPRSPTPEIASTAVEQFETPRGVVVSSPSPALKAALSHLGRAWPHAVAFDELAQSAAAALAAGSNPPAGVPPGLSAEDRAALVHNLMQCSSIGAIDLYSDADSFVTRVTDRPCASRLARLQSRSGPQVTNRRHEPVKLDNVDQNLLRYLDGEHDRPALLQCLVEAVDRGELSVLVNGVPARRGHSVVTILADILEQSLNKLANSALLVA
jgi:methyltransferase-like protein/trans-aconitate methyltransferase